MFTCLIRDVNSGRELVVAEDGRVSGGEGIVSTRPDGTMAVAILDDSPEARPVVLRWPAWRRMLAAGEIDPPPNGQFVIERRRSYYDLDADLRAMLAAVPPME